MEASFWHEKWASGRIGFHEKKVNPLLLNHVGKLNLDKGSRIFLPLCGKTLDISYLMSLAYHVVGIEFSEIAIQELFQELQLSPTITKTGEHSHYQADGIDIFVGDFFALDSKTIRQVDAVYDRASLVALPFKTRQSYTKHLIEITNTAPQLLVCLEYDQTVSNGPPFSISEDEIKNHYENLYSLECVESNSLIGDLKGKFDTIENTWVLKPMHGTS